MPPPIPLHNTKLNQSLWSNNCNLTREFLNCMRTLIQTHCGDLSKANLTTNLTNIIVLNKVQKYIAQYDNTYKTNCLNDDARDDNETSIVDPARNETKSVKSRQLYNASKGKLLEYDQGKSSSLSNIYLNINTCLVGVGFWLKRQKFEQ